MIRMVKKLEVRNLYLKEDNKTAVYEFEIEFFIDKIKIKDTVEVGIDNNLNEISNEIIKKIDAFYKKGGKNA